MTESQALALIENAKFEKGKPQHWADLGCGSGLFSYALGELLPRGSRVLMVDKENQAPIRSPVNGVNFEFLQVDFSTGSLPVKDFDGILMANSLHYVKDKPALFQKLRNQISGNGRFIIIEYDTENGNPWIPYPIPFTKLKRMLEKEGLNNVRKIGERPSRYGQKNMYACEVIPTRNQ